MSSEAGEVSFYEGGMLLDCQYADFFLCYFAYSVVIKFPFTYNPTSVFHHITTI